MTLGVRDTRKIDAVHNLTASEVRGEARFDDSIGIFPEFIDGYGPLILPTTGRYFHVPYRSLLLLLAGMQSIAPELHEGSVPRAVKAAGGRIWAPNQTFLTPAMLSEARALGIAVIPWTVNDPATMARLIEMGVDGIISDRPDLVQVELGKRR